jgi:hypothetical protein
MMRRRRPRYAVLILSVGFVLLALGCGLGAVAVRQGVITPPNLSLELGGVRLVGITSNSPDCTQLIAPGCIRPNQAPTVHIYTLWLLVQSQPNSWSQPHINQLLWLQIGE